MSEKKTILTRLIEKPIVKNAATMEPEMTQAESDKIAKDLYLKFFYEAYEEYIIKGDS
jgi:hypothetical protein